LIGGDLDVDSEDSKQNGKPLKLLYHSPIGYQSVRTQIDLIPASAIENTSRNREEAIRIVDE
jgi:hypothetical protein